VLALVIVAAFLGVGFLYSGIYPIGADSPHTKLVLWGVETLRDHSVARRSDDIVAPDLTDSTMIVKGAGQYAAMCSECHLAPGYNSTELRDGLYPRPPRLARDTDLGTREAFWITKHGLKLTGMPAWGPTHSDQEIWSIVAFLKKLPSMSREQYDAIVARAPRDGDRIRMPMPGGAVESPGHE